MEKPKKPIQYIDGYLTINIKESNPAYLHQNLLRAMALVMRSQITQPVNSEADADAMLSLTKLMETLVPNESDLLRAFEKS